MTFLGHKRTKKTFFKFAVRFFFTLQLILKVIYLWVIISVDTTYALMSSLNADSFQADAQIIRLFQKKKYKKIQRSGAFFCIFI